MGSGAQAREDVEDEIRFHVEGRVEALQAAGLTESEARARARREFGDIEAVARECIGIATDRTMRKRGEGMGGWIRDVVLAVRRLRREPVFAGVAIATLALGIGANVAMFSILNAVVLRPLSYEEPDRLVRVWPTKNFNQTLVRVMAEQAPSLSGVAGVSGWSLTLTGEGEPERISAAAVSPSYFEVLGVNPLLGRGFAPEESRPDASDVVVLSHGLWQRRFGGDPDILGTSLRLAGHNQPVRQVVGVMGPDFRPLTPEAEAWVPLALRSGHTVASDSTWYVNRVVARLADGATVGRAHEEVRAVAARVKEEFPAAADDDEVRAAGVVPLKSDMTQSVGGALWLLLGAVGLVLLIACGNLANLLLARAGGKRRDAAIRASLGASRGRLVRQQLVESGVLAFLGGLVSLPVAAWTLAALAPAVAGWLPRSDAIRLDLPTLGFALALCGVSALVFGAFPSWKATNGDPQTDLRSGGRGTTASGGAHRLNRSLVMAEVTLAVILVSGAGLVLKSFWALSATDPGFEADGVLAVTVTPPADRYASPDARREYWTSVLSAVERIGPVEQAAAIHLLPLTDQNWNFPYLAEGHEPIPNQPLPSANFRVVTPGYFQTLRIPLREGRAFAPTDGPDAPAVGLVNESLARLLWPDESAVGKEILLFGSSPFTVVGVVEDVRQTALSSPARPELYVPFEQWTNADLHLMIRVSGDPAAVARDVREAVWSVDQDVPIPATRPLTEVVRSSVAGSRFFALLLAAFGLLALGLGTVGVYGVMAYVTDTRKNEFGVRIALGARPEDILRSALRTGMTPVAGGLVVGLVGALLSTRLLTASFFSVQGIDPLVLVGVCLLLGAVAAAATWLPARRASLVDPARVLASD